MATNINITVGDDDLVARARQEMAAHRSGSNIAQSRTKAGEKGKTERARRLATQGKDGQGRIIPTAPFQPPRRPDEITAQADREPQVSLFGVGRFNADVDKLAIWPAKGEPVVFDLDPFPVWTPLPSLIEGGTGTGSLLVTTPWTPPPPPPGTLPAFSCYIGSNGNKADEGTPKWDWVLADPFTSQWQQRQFSLSTESLKVETTLVLPLDKDRSIFVHKYYDVFYDNNYYTSNLIRTSIDKTLVEDPDGFFADFFVLGQYIEATFESTYRYSEYKYETVSSFLVTKNSVRKIPTPQPMVDLLALWNPLPSPYTETITVQNPGGQTVLGQEGIQQCTDIYDPVNNTSFGLTNVSRTQTIQEYNWPNGRSDIETGVIKKIYGLGFLTTPSHERVSFPECRVFSPLLYTVMDDPAYSTVLSNPTLNRSYADAKQYAETVGKITLPNQFFSISQATSYSKDAEDRDIVTYRFTFATTKTVPTFSNVPLDEDELRPLKQSTAIEFSELLFEEPYYSFYAAWDWNRPSYCRRKAAEYGYTASVLS